MNGLGPYPNPAPRARHALSAAGSLTQSVLVDGPAGETAASGGGTTAASAVGAALWSFGAVAGELGTGSVLRVQATATISHGRVSPSTRIV